MSRQRLAALSVSLLLLMLAAFWYFSPYVTLHAMRNAAQAHDAAALARHVDFPRVRESLKGQVRALTARQARDIGGDHPLARAGAAFGAMLGNLVGNTLVDVLVTPERLADAMREGELKEPSAAGEAAGPKQEKQWAFERRGMNVFVAKALDSSGEADIGFVLEREGFATWRLVGIELPRSP
jgi:hypothetical protein